MPVQYAQGITAEHKAVRERCGMFDVSHMGEFWITGDRAVDFVNYVTTNDVAALAVGQVHYSTILNDRGTIEDDCLVYRFADRIMMVVNARTSRRTSRTSPGTPTQFGVTLEDASDEMALLALQGPKAAAILQPLTDTDLSTIKYYHFAEGEVAGMPTIISRTGYTGEDGFELYIANEYAVAALGRAAWPPATSPPPDSARATRCASRWGWRSTATTSTTPSRRSRRTSRWLVKLKKGDFVGRDALDRAEGARRDEEARRLHDAASATSRGTAIRCSTTARRAARCAAAR